MKVLNVDRKNLKATIKIDGQEIECNLTRFDYPYFVGYNIDKYFAIRTSHGNKLHCATGQIQFKKDTHWEGDQLIGIETDKQGIDFSWSGARGNGVGNFSRLAYIGLASNFKKEDFSKQTQYLVKA